MTLIEGIAAILIGIFLFITPKAAILILVQILGWYWLISGILAFVSLFIDRSNWGWKVAGGVLGVIAGFIVIRNPLWSGVVVLTTLVLIVGILALVMGATKIVQGIRGDGAGIAILGVLSFIVGLLLVFFPLNAVLVSPFVLGIIALLGGIGAVVMAFRQHNHETAGLTTTHPATPQTQ
jgi:uncharacterized membrane protein HdeD (DUF308 family)